MCVQPKGWRNLVASCVTPAQNGMVIETESPDVIEARKVVLELMLARHKLTPVTPVRKMENVICRITATVMGYRISLCRKGA